MKKYFKLLRVRHYLKNILVFIPLFFSHTLFTPGRFVHALLGFFAFCALSSAIYIINDVRDVEKDRQHPTKRFRPIASGAVSVRAAGTATAVCFAAAAALGLAAGNLLTLALLLLYFVLNLLYSLGLKNRPIVDVVILAAGYVIRVVYGAALVSVPVSGWLYLMVWTAACYMGLGKRRNEIMRQDSSSGSTRAVLRYYTYGFLDKNMYVCVALANVFYALWALDQEDQRFLLSVPLLMVLFMKYSLSVEGASDGDPIEVVLHDKVLLCLAAILAVYLFWLLYF